MKKIPKEYDDMFTYTPKKFGRKSARKKLKNDLNDIYSEYLWSCDVQLFNTWDFPEWDDHGRHEMLCNDIEEYGDWGEWDTEVVRYYNMMEWTNDAIKF